MDFKEFINFVIQSFITPLFGLLVGAAVVFFLWNIFGVVKSSNQPEELAKFKSKAIWGIVAIAVMISMWGLINFVTGTLQMDTGRVSLPQYNIN